MGSFSGAFIRDFNGGSKSDQIPGSGGHGIHLWFALVGVFVDCPFFATARTDSSDLNDLSDLSEWGLRLAGDTLCRGSGGEVDSMSS